MQFLEDGTYKLLFIGKNKDVSVVFMFHGASDENVFATGKYVVPTYAKPFKPTTNQKKILIKEMFDNSYALMSALKELE